MPQFEFATGPGQEHGTVGDAGLNRLTPSSAQAAKWGVHLSDCRENFESSLSARSISSSQRFMTSSASWCAHSNSLSDGLDTHPSPVEQILITREMKIAHCFKARRLATRDRAGRIGLKIRPYASLEEKGESPPNSKIRAPPLKVPRSGRDPADGGPNGSLTYMS